MDFELTENQRMLRETAERVARDRYSFGDRKSLLTALPEDIVDDWQTVADLGLPSILIPEAHGGMGGGFHDLFAVLEPLGEAFLIEPLTATAVLGAGAVQLAGSDGQKVRLLPGVADGSLKIALAHGEAHSRYRLTDVRTTATRADGGYRLSGGKSLALGGAGAQMFVVSARTSGEADDEEGISLFLIPRDAAGLTVIPYRNWDLTDAADLVLDGVEAADADVLGEAGAAASVLEHVIDRGIAAYCAEAVGAMTALQQLTLEHIRTRVAFGQTLGSFQVLQHRMADMIVACEQARSMAVLAADQADNPDRAARGQAISAAKVQVGQSGRFVGQQGMQLHGAMAITLDYPAGYYHKRLTVLEHLLGDVDHHLQRFADCAGY